MSSKSKFESDTKKIERYQTKIKSYKDSISSMSDRMAELSLFSIEDNDPALTYFEDQGYKISELLPLIKDGLYRQNEYTGEEHPLIPYASNEGDRMQINTIRILNHKWIIADFTDGQFWGELLLTYYIDENSQLKYTLKESFLYPMQ
jgi:hypothetical protein